MWALSLDALVKAKAVSMSATSLSRAQSASCKRKIKLNSDNWPSRSTSSRYVAGSADGSLVFSAACCRWHTYVRPRWVLDVTTTQQTAAIMLFRRRELCHRSRSIRKRPSDIDGTLQGDAGMLRFWADSGFSAQGAVATSMLPSPKLSALVVVRRHTQSSHRRNTVYRFPVLI